MTTQTHIPTLEKITNMTNGFFAKDKKQSTPKKTSSNELFKKIPHEHVSPTTTSKTKKTVVAKNSQSKNSKKETESLENILLKLNYISEDDLTNANKTAKTKQISVIDALLLDEIITEDLLGQAKAELFDVPYANLFTKKPAHNQVLIIPQQIAEKHRVVLVQQEGDTAIVATDNPRQEKLIEILHKANLRSTDTQKSFRKIKLTYGLTEQIDELLTYYRKSLDTRFSAIIKKSQRVAPDIVEEILMDALTFRASDIHFEPQETEVIIRFRIDGLLQKAGEIPKQFYESILNRIKVQARLRIDEHYSAQDGSIHFTKSEKKIDLRVSILPTIDGEKIVMRMLAAHVKDLALKDLGFSAEDENIITKNSRKPFGMILITGPTGSGKTTTLYSVLKMLNKPEVNIATIEDPVEYKISGINHIQVNSQTNLTFSEGLKSIVRQDPDIILVGEIRDRETSEIAVNAALTGHLLFSTFHANDAATAIPRLFDMGVEPFLIASTLELIASQRLIRKICPQCKTSISVSQNELNKKLPHANKYFPEKNTNLYIGKGCANCNHTGYHGRSAIFEFIEASKAMKALVLKNPSSEQIWDLAKKQGSRSMFEDGISKVKNGITTLDELLRVANPNMDA
jgi:type II secretory ATPase GspE/PulE/Tfp pilus assembly ATPase PilB-like protein